MIKNEKNCETCETSLEGKRRQARFCSIQCRYSEKQKQRNRGVYYKRLYGITYEDYEKTLLKQNGRCAICKSDDPVQGKVKTRFPVDHDHKTGKFRGLLCSRCNRGLGLFNEDSQLIRLAAEYIEKEGVI